MSCESTLTSGPSQKAAGPEVELPPPDTLTNFYLAAILGELRCIRATLEKPQPPQEAGLVDLKEPAKKKGK